MYPKEMYRNNHYRVVFGGEEERAMAALGWKVDMDRSRAEYVLYHSGIPEDLPEEKRGPGRPKKADAE